LWRVINGQGGSSAFLEAVVMMRARVVEGVRAAAYQWM
jgi:hypothetical protein